MAPEVLRRRVHDEIDTPVQRPQVVRRGEGGVDHGLHAVRAPDGREPLEVQDAVVGVGRRLAHEDARRRLDRVFQRLVVAGGDRRDLDAVPGQHGVEELTRATVAVVRHDDVGAARQQRVEHGRHRAHPAREQETVRRSFERRELRLRDLLRRVAVPPVVDAGVDLAVEVILQLLAVRPRVGRRLDDRRGERVRGLLPRLAAMDRQGARTGGLLRGLELVGHQDARSRAFSTWRAMARATRFGSAGSSTGLLRCVGLMASSEPMW